MCKMNALKLELILNVELILIVYGEKQFYNPIHVFLVERETEGGGIHGFKNDLWVM